MRTSRAGWIVVWGSLLVPSLGMGQQPAGASRLHDELIATDRAAADTAMLRGPGAAIASVGAPDVVLLYPGAPVVTGREAARQLLESQSALKALTLRWVPLHGEVSQDGSFGVTYGVTGVANAQGDPPLRFAKYLSAWRHGADGWKLVAHVQVGLLPGPAYAAPDGFTPAPLAPLSGTGPGAEFARADRAFAALAGKQGAPTAFAAFAAADAVTFAGSGELNRGPGAIRRWLDGDDAMWRWEPVVQGGASDLGFTIGHSVITPKEGAASYGKYLTLWRREAGGKVRYLADGGNARPAPVSP